MLALLSLTAAGLAADCPAEPLQVVGAIPPSNATGVPLDARLIGILGDGLGTADEWTITLDWAEGSFPGTTESWCHPEGGPARARCFLAFTPAEPLPPNTDFNLLLDTTDQWTGTGSDREAFFITTGTASAVTVDGKPQVEVLSLRDDTPDCGWAGARVWDLALTASSADFYGLSLLHVYGVDTDNATHHVATRAISAAGGLMTVTVSRDSADPWTDCFVAIQEDALGNRSQTSELACWQEPDDTALDTGDTGVGVGGCGCTTGPHPAPPLPWLALAALGWRRRTTGARP